MARANDQVESLLAVSRYLLDPLPAQVWIKDACYRFLYVNPVFTRSIGCSVPTEAIGVTERPFFARSRVDEFRTTDREAISRSAAIVVPEQGERGGWYETLKVPLHSAKGRPAGTLGVAWDVSRWWAARARLDRLATETPNSAAAGSAAARRRPAGEGPPEWLVTAVERLTADPETRLTAAAAAAELGVHPDSLGRSFARYLGVLLSRYRQWLRAGRARDALLSGQQPLADLALEAGYADQSHMTREVKRFFGLTPASLRRLSLGQTPAARGAAFRRPPTPDRCRSEPALTAPAIPL